MIISFRFFYFWNTRALLSGTRTRKNKTNEQAELQNNNTIWAVQRTIYGWFHPPDPWIINRNTYVELNTCVHRSRGETGRYVNIYENKINFGHQQIRGWAYILVHFYVDLCYFLDLPHHSPSKFVSEISFDSAQSPLRSFNTANTNVGYI